MSVGYFWQLRRFASVGVLNTLVGLSTIYVMKWSLQLGDVVSNAIGYTVGLLLSFSLNGRWTFMYHGAYLPALAKFVLATLVAYGINLLTVVIALHYLGVNAYLAQALGIIPYTLTSYFGAKHFVFRGS